MKMERVIEIKSWIFKSIFLRRFISSIKYREDYILNISTCRNFFWIYSLIKISRKKMKYLQNNSSDRNEHHAQHHFPTMIVFLVKGLSSGAAMTSAPAATEEQAYAG